MDKKITLNQSNNIAISTEGVDKIFHIGDRPFHVLKKITIDIPKESFTVIYGPSGSGKSTFLNIITGLEQPSAGKVTVLGKRLDLMKEDRRSDVRLEKIGVVSQQPVWIKAVSVLDNVAMPLLIKGEKTKVAHKKATEALIKVGMNRYAHRKPTEISGGEQQKVSLARALVANQQIIVLDEPTGNLDTHSADQILVLLKNLNTESKKTIVMVTHNLIYLPYATRAIGIEDGKVEGISEKMEEFFAKAREKYES